MRKGQELATVPLTKLIKRIEDAELKVKQSLEALDKEQTRYKELEIRWKAVCNKKDKDLGESRQKIARLQVQVSAARISHATDSNSVPSDNRSSAESEDLEKSFTSICRETTFAGQEKEFDIKQMTSQVQ